MDQQTDRRTKGLTKPLIELRVRGNEDISIKTNKKLKKRDTNLLRRFAADKWVAIDGDLEWVVIDQSEESDLSVDEVIASVKHFDRTAIKFVSARG